MILTPLLRFAKPAAYVLLAASLFGGGYYLRDLQADRDEARAVAEVAQAALDNFREETNRLSGLSYDLHGRVTELLNAKPKIIERYTKTVVERPLPDGCVLDADRLRHINDAIAAANAASEPGAAVPTGTDARHQ